MATTYTVKKGDTLSEIALANGTTVAKLVELNDISDPDYIVVGQVLTLSGSASSTKTNNTSRATIKAFGLQSNSENTLYATWTWSKSNTENYQTIWYYDTGDSIWFIGSDSTTENKQCTYSIPTNAIRVKFKVKPISKTHTVNDKDVSYWTASWSTEKIYKVSDNPPKQPSAPNVTIEKFKLTAKLENLDLNATGIQFQIVKNDKSVYKTGTAKIVTNSATYSCNVDAGNEYKVRCRSYRGKIYSDWSEYSSNEGTIPAAPAKITTCRASSETSVYLAWSASKTAETYEVEYTTKKEYFDGSDQTSSKTGIEFTHYDISGLETGEEYFFRVRATNTDGSSSWSGIKSVVIGKAPAAPTTWSSTTTAIVGETVNLYFVHNPQDESKMKYAEVQYAYTIAGGTGSVTETIEGVAEDEDETTYSFALDTSEYIEGNKIQWRVRTAGITLEYGEWSIVRTIDIYAPPTLELAVTDVDGNALETLTTFPFYIAGLPGPNTQVPTGYYVTITANESYETVDNMGDPITINVGDAVYSKYFDISEALVVEMSASNVNLDNNISYTVTCRVSMNSGLTAESSVEFNVAWTDEEYEPNAEIGIDTDDYSASIRPYCEDENGDLIEGVLLSVYRREFNGGFTEIASDIPNTSNTFVTDPHPSLDFARYRIVAKTESTGAISYYDVPGYPVGCTSIILQWNEDWTSFDTSNEDEMEQPTWSGSMLKLPYNIDVSDSFSPDVSHVEYIGREHPVSYYGTQLGETSSWSTDIPKSDKDTLYALRRLAKWMGDVYVREPSGSGYWANVRVSFSQTHCEVIIPVSLDIIRVEGGI